MISGIAGGIQPRWHYVAAYHEDRRIYNTRGPVMRWAKQNEQFLVDRQPIASVGVLWSQRNTDFFGRNEAADLADAPYTGFMHALARARIALTCPFMSMIWRQPRDSPASYFRISADYRISRALRFGNSQAAVVP
jgi:hypothetical protein